MQVASSPPHLGPLGRESFLGLVAALEEHRRAESTGRPRSVQVTGLPGAGKALYLLGLHRALAVPFVIVARSDAEAESLHGDLRSLAAALGLADPEAVRLFPSLDADPYQGLAPHLSRVTGRVKTMASAVGGRIGLLVAPVEALFTALEPPSSFAPRCRPLRPGDDWGEADDLAWFVNAGYERVDLVGAPGEFSRRGGVVDVFPPAEDAPLRVELDGTTIDSIRRFDPAGQRSTERVGSFLMTPARELSVGGAERASLSRALMRRGEAAGKLIGLLERQGRFPGVEACARLALGETASIADYVPGAVLAVDEPEMTREEARNLKADFLRSWEASPSPALPPPGDLLVPDAEIEEILDRRAGLTLRHLRIGGEEGEGGPSFHVAAAGSPSYLGRSGAFVDEIKRRLRAAETTCILMSTPGTATRMREILLQEGLGARPLPPEDEPQPEGAGVYVGCAPVSSGFGLPDDGWHLAGERELFGGRPAARPRAAGAGFASDFRDLKVGDLVVHIDHGIGRYDGLVRVAGSDPGGAAPWAPTREVEAMILTYHNNDRLYVPMDRLDLIQKYTGAGGRPPTLDRLGGQSWSRTKKRVRREMEEMAVELLNLYAARKTVEGHAFSADGDWQSEFEEAFPWELTPDQKRAVEEIKRDMENPSPMDRLLCGDVGFGKTEVALRAAFKSVMDGRQVAVLAPTTVLAFQHWNTFRERFAPFPTRVEMISRFRSEKEQDETVARAAAGEVDILIGTHRLLSADVVFRNLGLLIVDEEQRFGVTHKERIKKLKRSVDVLTLTATPIPRTLQMAMAGVVDLSLVETPPESRLAIQTHLVPFKEAIIAPAIRHELQRGGQVYFVHNRVESIYAAAALVQRLVPEARVLVGHGQMAKHQLEDAMMTFVRGDADVLVSTTIIENGIDIPRVNTLIVNRADRFGLSQLYQLRGRIGRSDRQAYAYLLVPPEKTLSETARRRLQALQDFTDLGSGFRIAAMDLEIRGAGDLLGRRQHGQIASVGFEMYCRMLQRTIEEMRTGTPLPEFRTQIHLGVELRIPESYVPEEGLRLVLYKKIASALTEERVDEIRDEMEDRFGRLPAEARRLIDAARLRLLAEKLHVQQIDHRAGVLQVRFSESTPLDPARLLPWIRSQAGASLSPAGVLRLPAPWEPDARASGALGVLRLLE